MHIMRNKLAAAAVGLAIALSGVASADVHYAHEHVIRELPHEHLAFDHHGDHYYFAHGYWYHGYGPGFIAVAPPFGLHVTVLPYGYRTVVVAGAPYFVLNDVWYQQIGPDYVVVAQPAGAIVDGPAVVAQAAPPAAPASQDFFMYPRNGQSEKQQAQDRYECHAWARQQAGFDPTLPSGGVAVDVAAQKHSDYQRAMSACLDGRGYTVR